MINSKQRALLRGLAAGEDTIIIVGKGGITSSLIDSVSDALAARELVKGKVLENSEYDARSACAELCERTAACPVQVIGSKFVLYRPSHRKDKKDKIVLVKGDK